MTTPDPPREIFPVSFYGPERTGMVSTPVVETPDLTKSLEQRDVTARAHKDFRLKKLNPAVLAEVPEQRASPEEVPGPKDPSATGSVSSSPNESQTSLVDLEALRAFVERGLTPMTLLQGEQPEQQVVGETVPPVLESPLGSEESLISSSPFL